ncbi:MAG: hypothetical protein HN757_09920 [Calditrichaeota bacterium]|jgi:hypothetical protein|nr:hypothetical protein [Calditrichota bacterium]
MSAITEFNKKVINEFVESITDRVFLMIEDDKDLMAEYLRLISDNTLNAVNTSLGLAVKELLKLENIEIEEEPDSFLIRSYTKHKLS